MSPQTFERTVNVVATSGVGGGIVTGITIGQLNEYLQAAAFCVAIISGICASFYYIVKASRKD